MSNPKHIPILFKPEMVNAILEGRKTQTRRLNGLDMINKNPAEWEVFKKAAGANQPYSFYSKNDIQSEFYLKQPYQIGNVLWVREKIWKYLPDGNFIYYAEGTKPMHFGEFKMLPSIHMPKEACRIFLEITNVRVERLKDISEDDAFREGMIKHGSCAYHHSQTATDDDTYYSPYIAFKNLWEIINGADSWKANPFVWAITFKRIDKPANWPNK
jgi:hypothetical protein